MKKGALKTLTVTFAIGIIFVFFLGIAITSRPVTGANNQTLLAIVNITNTEPHILSVTIAPSSIDLSPGNTTAVNCTGIVNDYNGWDDVMFVNATIYHTDYGFAGDADKNYRYINASCQSSCVQYAGSATNASCTCVFNLQYYAYNGSWTCNMSAADAFNVSDTENSSVASINSVIGISTPDELDYGNMSVTETSGFVQANISNFGNVPINISVRGYGGTDDTLGGIGNWSMICETGNISMQNHRYTLNNTLSFDQMLNLSNTTTRIDNLNLPIRTNDLAPGNDTNTTFWKLQIPANVAGFCNGSVEFSAASSS